MIDFFGLTDVGCVRTENQDRILTDPSLGAFIVADGMGGQSHGEVAAELSVSALRYYLESSQDRYDVTWPFGYDFTQSIDANRLITGFQLANQHVWRHSEQKPEYAGMGSTLAALLATEENIISANVGDSRIYRLREGELSQLSYDDTFVNSIFQRGNLTPAELRNHPMRNVLTQAAGSKESLNVHIHESAVYTGDCYLLCSDGLFSVVSDEAIRAMLETGDSAETTVRRLVHAARAGGGPDNVACVVVKFNS